MIKTIGMALAACLTGCVLYGIEGTYSVTGNDPYGKNSYSGTAVITKDKNEVYQGRWDFEEGGKKYNDTGTGIKRNNEVSFIFKNASGQDEEYEGVQVYRIKGDILEGPFVLLNKNLVGNEKLVKQKVNE